MHITRKTNQELVVLDSSIWISVFLLCASAFASYRLWMKGDPKASLIVGLFLLFALLFWRREVVVFDGARQQATWTRRRLFKVAAGTIAFGEITGIGLETISSGTSQTYRLAILTAQASVPMADGYAGDRQKYENLRTEILQFLNLDSGALKLELPIDGIADAASVRSLLQQGRRIDAIHLVRTTQNISLTEATNLVAKMVEQMKTMQ
jgi:hypothetical protein